MGAGVGGVMGRGVEAQGASYTHQQQQQQEQEQPGLRSPQPHCLRSPISTHSFHLGVSVCMWCCGVWRWCLARACFGLLACRWVPCSQVINHTLHAPEMWDQQSMVSL